MRVISGSVDEKLPGFFPFFIFSFPPSSPLIAASIYRGTMEAMAACIVPFYISLRTRKVNLSAVERELRFIPTACWLKLGDESGNRINSTGKIWETVYRCYYKSKFYSSRSVLSWFVFCRGFLRDFLPRAALVIRGYFFQAS